MRLLATAAALLCVLAVLPGSATAKAGKPFDFEVAAPAPLATASAAGGRVVSRRISTAHRFNLVGMRWRGPAEPAIAVRVRRSRGGWSRWQRLDAHADHNPDPGARERVTRLVRPALGGLRRRRPVPAQPARRRGCGSTS